MLHAYTLFIADFSNAMSSNPLTPETWNNFKREEIDTNNIPPAFAYAAGKGIAERTFWEIAKRNPKVDFTACENYFLWCNIACLSKDILSISCVSRHIWSTPRDIPPAGNSIRPKHYQLRIPAHNRW